MQYSYVLGQIPSNMIIGYLRPSVYLCCMAIVWSGVSASMCGANSFTGLVLVRFFLGIVEAPLLPGAVYLMGCWVSDIANASQRDYANKIAVYASRDGYARRLAIHWADIGLLHGWTDCCCRLRHP